MDWDLKETLQHVKSSHEDRQKAAKEEVDNDMRENEPWDVTARLWASRASVDGPPTALGDVDKELDKHKHEIAKRDKLLALNQSKMKSTTDEYNFYICNANKTIVQKDKYYQEAMEACKYYKQALSDLQQFTKKVCDERIALRQMVADLISEQLRLVTVVDTLNEKIKVTLNTVTWDLKKTLQQVKSNHEDLQKNLAEGHLTSVDGLSQRPEMYIGKGRGYVIKMLEEHARLERMGSCNRADNAALQRDSITVVRSAEQVQELPHNLYEVGEDSKTQVERLQEEDGSVTSMSSSNQNELLQFQTNAKQEVDDDMWDDELELEDVRGQQQVKSNHEDLQKNLAEGHLTSEDGLSQRPEMYIGKGRGYAIKMLEEHARLERIRSCNRADNAALLRDSISVVRSAEQVQELPHNLYEVEEDSKTQVERLQEEDGSVTSVSSSNQNELQFQTNAKQEVDDDMWDDELEDVRGQQISNATKTTAQNDFDYQESMEASTYYKQAENIQQRMISMTRGSRGSRGRFGNRTAPTSHRYGYTQ